jgi:pantoate--beta-alanine ligase
MTVALVTTIEEVRSQLAGARLQGRSVGLVPTMGALHEGHASLLRAARAENGYVAATIFVNPTQFGPREDFARYPRTMDHDLEVCAREGVDLVFAPAPDTLYPPSYRTFVEVTGLQDKLCGASRPGHFRGVTTVVLKLFHIFVPDLAYFGQKDAQQVRIIQQLVQDLHLLVRIRVCPIVREPDGLALSSRNRYLEPHQRRQATVLYGALEAARAAILAGERDAARLRVALVSHIQTAPAAVLDYAAVVSATTLEPLERLRGEMLLALAVRFGTTRLIDNLQIVVPAVGGGVSPEAD